MNIVDFERSLDNYGHVHECKMCGNKTTEYFTLEYCVSNIGPKNCVPNKEHMHVSCRICGYIYTTKTLEQTLKKE
jgi:hypothetical protein